MRALEKVGRSSCPPLDAHSTAPGEFRVLRSYLRLPPKPGGMEKHIEALTLAQRAVGIEVVNLYNEGKPSGDSLHILPNVSLGRVIRPDVVRKAVFYSAMSMTISRIESTIPTVFHVHGDWKDFTFAAWTARSFKPTVLAATIHDAISSRHHAATARSLSPFHLVFCTGKGDQVALEQSLGRKVHHLPSAPHSIFAEGQRATPAMRSDVVSVGSLVNKKRVDLILECAARRREWRFSIYGDGVERERLERRSKVLNLDNVIFHGEVSKEEVLEGMISSRVFLSTATREGTPTGAMEAMSVGLPVVLTPSNVYDWLIGPGESGEVTNGWSVEQILFSLDALLGDEQRRVRMGAAARSRMSRENWGAKATTVSELMRAELAVQQAISRFPIH